MRMSRKNRMLEKRGRILNLLDRLSYGKCVFFEVFLWWRTLKHVRVGLDRRLANL